MSMQAAARRAVREFVSRGQHRDRLVASATPMVTKHADALRRHGNERLGWLATAVFLNLNGIKASRMTNDDVHDLVICIASSNPYLADITRRLQAPIVPRRRPAAR